jgi:hypothetical protein
MSHDTTERPADGAPDDLRERLNALGRAATAGSMPWPGVDDAIRRRRRTRAVTGAALGTAVAVLAGSVFAWSVSDPRTTTPPPATGGGVTRTPTPLPMADTLPEDPPWPLPSAPYRPVYEDVTVDFPLDFPVRRETCDTTFGLDLHAPERIATLPYDVTRDDYGVVLSIGCPDDGDQTNLSWGAPYAVPQGDATAPEDCVAAFRASSEVVPPSDVGAVVCLLAAPDPARDRPLMIVRLELTKDANMLTALGFEASAWTGGPPTQDGGLAQLGPPRTGEAPSV